MKIVWCVEVGVRIVVYMWAFFVCEGGQWVGRVYIMDKAGLRTQ